MKLHEQLRKRANERLASAQKLRGKALEEDRSLTAEETAEIERLENEAKAFEAQAVAAEANESQQARYSQGGGVAPLATGGRPQWEDDPARGFRSHRNFLTAVIAKRRGQALEGDAGERLASLECDLGEGAGFMLPVAFTPRALTAGSDEQGIYDESVGGSLVPTQKLAGLRETVWSGDPTASRTTKIPMTVPTVELDARVDKSHSTSVTGGFRVYRTGETQETAASRAQFEKVILRASKLMGLAYATSEILNYSPLSFMTIIEAGYRTEFASKVLDEKMRGTGAGEYTGILSSTTNPALIMVNKETNQTADTIVYANLVKMRSRIYTASGQPVWMAISDALEQLMQMTNAAGQLIWQPDATGGSPGTVLGLPLVLCEECSALGDLGDINLVNWAEYLEGQLRPIEGASSIHVRFLNDETAFRFTLSNAGAPWWRSVLTPKHGQTKSPFVTLQAR